MVFSEGEWVGRGQGNFFSLGWVTILVDGWIKLAKDMKMWKGNEYNITLLFSLKDIEILQQ